MAIDSTISTQGKVLDARDLARADGTVVTREIAILGDDVEPLERAKVRDNELQTEDSTVIRLLEAILDELKEMKLALWRFR